MPRPMDQGHQASDVAWAVVYVRAYYAAAVEGRETDDPTHMPSPSYIYNSIVENPSNRGGGARISDALLTQGLTDPDDVPELPTEPVARAGDLWVLGPHRLLCGDSTSPGDVKKLLSGVKPHLMITDPPYGVNYEPAWRKRAGVNLNTRKLGKVAPTLVLPSIQVNVRARQLPPADENGVAYLRIPLNTLSVHDGGSS
jgi:hypothetical protein